MRWPRGCSGAQLVTSRDARRANRARRSGWSCAWNRARSTAWPRLLPQAHCPPLRPKRARIIRAPHGHAHDAVIHITSLAVRPLPRRCPQAPAISSSAPPRYASCEGRYILLRVQQLRASPHRIALHSVPAPPFMLLSSRHSSTSTSHRLRSDTVVPS